MGTASGVLAVVAHTCTPLDGPSRRGVGRPPAPRPWPAPKDAAEGAEETITSPYLRRRLHAAREAAERRAALQAMRRSLRSGPARRLPAMSAGSWRRSPHQEDYQMQAARRQARP